jgi:hypothetical protein
MVQLFFVFGAFGKATTCFTRNAEIPAHPSCDRQYWQILAPTSATLVPSGSLGCDWFPGGTALGQYSTILAHSARLQPVLPGMLKSLRIRVVIANIGQYWPRLRRLLLMLMLLLLLLRLLFLTVSTGILGWFV